MPKLSTKNTRLYVVVATWADAKAEGKIHQDLSAAKSTAAEWRVRYPGAHVQTHELWQSLPEEK